jgi:formylglycine-generating enzyme required for sulfatase activity
VEGHPPAGAEAQERTVAQDVRESTLAQEGSAAASAGGIAVVGSVRDIIVGAAPSGSPAYLRAAYLSHVFESVGHLSLAGIDPKAAGERAEARLNLGAVYTALLTLTPEEHEAETPLMSPQRRERESRRLSALAQLDRHDRLVLLGDPGSGKSTFVNFVALCMAGALLKQAAADTPADTSAGTSEAGTLAALPDLTRLTEPLPSDKEKDDDEKPKPQPWSHGALLPVRVVLRDFAARGLPPPGEPATAKHLWAFIAAELDQAALGEYATPLARTLLKKGGLLLLDGLDEVPEAQHRREQIKQAVTDFAGTFKRCRILVTSRTYAYQQQAWRLPGFAEAVLAPFGEGQIRRFVDRWYAHIAPLRGIHPDDAEGRAALLKRAIFGSDRLRELAERPLLLTLTASLHAWRGGSLPENREELYADTVDLLLDWWERPKVVRDRDRVIIQQPSLTEWMRVERAQVRSLLNALAYHAHAEQPDLEDAPRGTADVPEGDLLSGLMRLSPSSEVHNNPALLLRYLSQRAGVLLPRGVGVYTFPHRTFQEYLAACYLTDHDYPDRVAELAREDPDRWREVALLAGAKSARGSDFALWALVEELCYCDTPEPPFAPRGSPDPRRLSAADAWGVLLAGQALVESADLSHVSPRNQDKLRDVRELLVRVLRGEGQLPAIERAGVGNALATLGDPRFRPDAWYLPDEPLLGFVEIPEGAFLMGEGNAQHEVTLPTYYIARYPVTVAQFRAYVEASGVQPKDADSLRGLANHPVVWVSWHEALAYCRWLTDMLRDWAGIPESLVGLLREGWQVMLPSEAEWEKAAGWDAANAEPRRYPWGDAPDPERANYEATGIGTTSAVGCFPGGASAYQVEDLSGNVWEWTRSLWGKSFSEPDFKYPYKIEDGREDLTAGDGVLRVVRGGSFNAIGWNVRCACRSGYDPDYVNVNLGVRVALVSPFFSVL